MIGTKLSLRGTEYMVPSATAADLIRLEEQVNTVLGIKAYPSAAEWKALGDLLHASLAANYPTKTREEVAGLLDSENFEDVIQAVLFGFMGLRKRREDEAKAKAAAKGEG